MSRGRIVPPIEKRIVKANEMKPGQIGKIVGHKDYEGTIVMKSPKMLAHSEQGYLINLSDIGEGKCWTTPTFDIELLPENTIIEITVNNKC